MAEKKKADQVKKTNDPFIPVVQELPFHDFQKDKTYIGLYLSTMTLGDKPESKFDVNVFADVETGEQKFITNSYAISKAIKEARLTYPENFENVVFKIEFEGKTEVKGKPLNKFKIGVCTLDQYKGI
jgi:hypothetical protein